MSKSNIHSKLCSHENIVVAYYAVEFSNKVYGRGIEILCDDCETLLFKSDHIEQGFAYIKRNKKFFRTMIDLTPDRLNQKFQIPDPASN